MQRLRRAVAIQSTIRLHRITSLVLSGTSSLITARPPCLIRTSAGTGLELNFLKRQLCPTVPAHRTDPLLDDCTSATAAREFESRCIYIRARSLRLSIAALSPPAIIVGVSPPLMACKPLRGLVKRFEMPCGRAGGGGARCRGSRNECHVSRAMGLNLKTAPASVMRPRALSAPVRASSPPVVGLSIVARWPGRSRSQALRLLVASRGPACSAG